MKDLMIGDWVKDSRHNLYLKVDIDALNWINEYPFEPIPLTGDLLEMNGWKGSALYWKCKKCPFELFINMGDGKPFINGHGSVCYDFRYVHQLQHALRLCGLNELADNFKIE